MTLLAAKRRARKAAEAYLEANPAATDAQVKAAVRADLKAEGFDPSFWMQLIEFILKIIQAWRNK
jgi:hypothetical protein